MNTDEDPSGWRPYHNFVDTLQEKCLKNEGLPGIFVSFCVYFFGSNWFHVLQHKEEAVFIPMVLVLFYCSTENKNSFSPLILLLLIAL